MQRIYFPGRVGVPSRPFIWCFNKHCIKLSRDPNCRSTGYAQSPAYRQRTCTCAYKQRDSMDINNGKQGNGKKPSAQDFHCRTEECRTEESPASAGSQSHCGSDHASMPCPPVGSCTVLVSSCSYTQQQQPKAAWRQEDEELTHALMMPRMAGSPPSPAQCPAWSPQDRLGPRLRLLQPWARGPRAASRPRLPLASGVWLAGGQRRGALPSCSCLCL